MRRFDRNFVCTLSSNFGAAKSFSEYGTNKIFYRHIVLARVCYFSVESSDSFAEVRNAVELLESMSLGNAVTVDSDSTKI